MTGGARAGGQAMLTVRLVGEFEVARAGQPYPTAALGSRKARTLLKLLAVERGRMVTVDRLVETVWGDDPPARPVESVATLVSRLRSALGADCIVGGRDGYRLGSAPAVVVDLDQAAAQLHEAEQCLAARPDAAGIAAARALTLLDRGSALAGDSYASWAEPARAEAAELLRRARHAAARAALATADPATAAAAAKAAITADPVDEIGYRLLMHAFQASGEPARALAAFERLRETLATELGTDPAPQTRELHVAILRAEAAPAASVPGTASAPGQGGADVSDSADGPGRSLGAGAEMTDNWVESPDEWTERLAGRDDECAQIEQAWTDATSGRAHLLLITGEAGIGKTSLAGWAAEAAARAGATVLRARCYEAESSLFLQPFADMLSRQAASMAPRQLAQLVGDRSAALADLVPALFPTSTGSPPPAQVANADLQRRLVFEAVAGAVRGLADHTPVLMFLDDLQSTGMSTVELMHYVIRTLNTTRLLVIATIRIEEGGQALRMLAEVATQLELGPLPADAVHQLAADSGRADLGELILRQTRGHALYVVETLRGLTSGEPGLPPSLQEVVLARVRRAGPAVAELLRTAAIVGATLDPSVLGRILGVDLAEVARRCEEALGARLLTVAGREYEFANDLIREVLYATTPAPTRIAHHRRAAELLSDRPEAVAAHSAAAGDWVRAARAYLVAGEQAMRRFAGEDAHTLLDLAMAAAERPEVDLGAPPGGHADRELLGRIHIARGRVREGLRRYGLAQADFRTAIECAREAGDQRLEMVALVHFAGDVAVALHEPIDALAQPLQRALRIAESLADRGTESVLLSRLAVLAANRLRLDDAVQYGRQAALAGRQAGDDRALAAGLDGLKTSLFFLGEAAQLAEVIEELEPLWRRLGDLQFLQWTVFESAFIPFAAGDWDETIRRIDLAVDINRRSGFAAYEAWFIAHAGAVQRLRGETGVALAHSRRAVALVDDAPHPWWAPATYTQLALTLLDGAGAGDGLGDGDGPSGADRAEAVALLHRAREVARPHSASAHLAPATALLAELTGSAELLAEADALLRAITTPEDGAWLYGVDAYRATAQAHLARGEAVRAREIVAPVLRAAARVPSVPAQVEILLVDGSAAMALGDPEAPAIMARAAALATRYRLPRQRAAAHAALAQAGAEAPPTEE